MIRNPEAHTPKINWTIDEEAALDMLTLISVAHKYPDTETELMIGRIVNVSAYDSILGDDGKIDADKAHFLSFDPAINSYRTLGPVAGRSLHDGLALSYK